MKSEILNIIAKTIEIKTEELRMDQTFEELEIDSILFIRMVVQCETTFSMQFEDEMLLMSCFPVLGDFVNYVEQRRGEQSEEQGKIADSNQME